MRGSIRTRLLAGTAIGVSLTFAVSGILVYTLSRSQLYTQFDDHLAARTRALTALIEQSGTTIETDLDREELATEYHQLWQGTATLRRSKSLGTHELHPYSPSVLTVDAVTLPDGRRGRQATYVFHPVQDDDRPASAPITLAFAVAQDTDAVDDTIARLGHVLIGVGFVATFACLVLLALVIRFGLAPVRELAAAIAELREGNLAARLATARTPQELRPVVERLNELLRRLDIAFTRERALTAEVAHELRTPMAGLRATIELALDRVRTPERYQKALADCLAIVVQTERTVASLLSLARLDVGMVAASPEPVAVAELIREVLAQHAVRAGERELTVEPELAVVTRAIDRDKLRVVIDNLVDNAVTYANHGGTVRVELAANTLVVTNTGCTLAPDQAARVFDRFWRADAARSGSHAGIGLALCKKLAELLGATLAVTVLDDRFIATVAWEGGRADERQPRGGDPRPAG